MVLLLGTGFPYLIIQLSFLRGSFGSSPSLMSTPQANANPNPNPGNLHNIAKRSRHGHGHWHGHGHEHRHRHGHGHGHGHWHGHCGISISAMKFLRWQLEQRNWYFYLGTIPVAE